MRCSTRSLNNRLLINWYCWPVLDIIFKLRSAATKVLNNYELDIEGNPVTNPATVLWSVATPLRSTATLVSNINGLNSQDSEQGHPKLHRPVDQATRVEPVHLSGEIEEMKLEPETQ